MSAHEYRPEFAPHVVGRYGERVRDPEDGTYEEQRVDLTCERCGTTARAYCRSGRPRAHVAQFARAHLHREPRRNPGSGGPV